jgi:hypothetical protein
VRHAGVKGDEIILILRFNGDIRPPAKAILKDHGCPFRRNACVDVDKVKAVLIEGIAARAQE